LIARRHQDGRCRLAIAVPLNGLGKSHQRFARSNRSNRGDFLGNSATEIRRRALAYLDAPLLISDAISSLAGRYSNTKTRLQLNLLTHSLSVNAAKMGRKTMARAENVHPLPSQKTDWLRPRFARRSADATLGPTNCCETT